MKKKYIKPIIRVIDDDELIIAASPGFGAGGDNLDLCENDSSGDEEHPEVNPGGDCQYDAESGMTKGNGFGWDFGW